MPMVMKLYKLPDEPTLEGIRPMGPKDVAGVSKLINNGLSKFVVKFHYTDEEIKHFFLPRENVVYTYVLDKIEKEG